jgi:hypothetical protein
VVPSNEKNVNLVRGSRVRNLIAPGVSRLRKSNKSKRGAAKLNGLDNTSLQGIRIFARQKPVAARLMDDQTFKYSSVPVGAEPYST